MTGPITFQTMPVVTPTSAADVPTHLGLANGTAQRSNANFTAINAWATRRMQSLHYVHETGDAVAVPDAHWIAEELQGARIALAGDKWICTVFIGLLYVNPTVTFTTSAGSGDLTVDLPLYTPATSYLKVSDETVWTEQFAVSLYDSGSPQGSYGGGVVLATGGAARLVKLSAPGLVISKALSTRIRICHTYLTGATA